MRKAMWLLAVIACLVFSFAAFAQQPITGTLKGVVGDRDGKPLPGATVVVIGPLGERGTQTDDAGNYQFVYLPTGTYKVKVELAGFSTIEIPGVNVGAGLTTRLPISLLPGQEEEINVSATPLVDAKRTEVVTSFQSKETVETLPVKRNFIEAVQFAPGVVDGGGTGEGNYSIGGSSGLENSYIIDGVNITDSGYGGVGTYSGVYGSLGTGISGQFLEEIQVKTAGFEAEYGQALGGVVGGTLRTGTNDLMGNVSAYLTPASWEAQGKDVVLPAGAFNTHEREETDLGVSVGGPIVKDKLFWTAGFNPVETSFEVFAARLSNPLTDIDLDASETYPDTDNVFPSSGTGKPVERNRDNYFGKLNWSINTNHRLDFAVFGDPSDGDGRSGANAGRFVMSGTGDPDGDGTNAAYSKIAAFSGDARRSTLDYGADQQSLRYQGLFGTDWLVEGILSHRKNEFSETPIVDDHFYTDNRLVREQFFSFPQTLNNSVAPTAGGPGFIGSQLDETWEYAAKVSKTWGGHEVKAGVDFFDLEYKQPAIYSGPQFDVTYSSNLGGGTFRTTSGAIVQVRGGIPGCTVCTFSVGSPLYRVTRARFSPSDDPVEGEETALFVQDTWTINDKWIVKLGVRSSSQELRGAGAFTLGDTTFEPNSFKFKTEFSPRVGFTFDPKANGKTKFSMNYARYFERIPADLAVRQFSNEVGATSLNFRDPELTNQANQGFIQGAAAGIVCGGRGDDGICTGESRLPYVDELVIGWEQLLRPDLAVTVRGIYRDQGRVLEDVQFASNEQILNYYYGYDLNGDGTFTDDENPFPGYGAQAFGAYVLANPGETTEDVFGTPKREYKALELVLDKKLADRWAFQANYRFSRLRGNYEGLFRNDNGQSDPNISALYDFPAIGTDGRVSQTARGQFASGALNTDRPHVLHLVGKYMFDSGFEVGAILNWQSGTPRTPLLAHPTYQNAGEIPGQDPQYVSLVDDPDGDGTSNPTWVVAPAPLAGEAFLFNYTDAPRGSLGRNPDISTIDLHFGYRRAIRDTSLRVQLDIFNLFNNQEAFSLDDTVELTAAVRNPNFNKINDYQLQRAVRFGVSWDF
jgi:hypothetical protein